jgi:hypothetical protein
MALYLSSFFVGLSLYESYGWNSVSLEILIFFFKFYRFGLYAVPSVVISILINIPKFFEVNLIYRYNLIIIIINY